MNTEINVIQQWMRILTFSSFHCFTQWSDSRFLSTYMHEQNSFILIGWKNWVRMKRRISLIIWREIKGIVETSTLIHSEIETHSLFRLFELDWRFFWQAKYRKASKVSLSTSMHFLSANVCDKQQNIYFSTSIRLLMKGCDEIAMKNNIILRVRLWEELPRRSFRLLLKQPNLQVV